MIMPALKESQQHNSDVRGQVLATLAKLANTVGLAKISTFIEQNDLELLLRLTMIELQHSLMTYKSTEKMTENESNSAIYNYFIVLEQYLSVFGDESLQAHQVLLSRMCAEMMERIEKQLTELVAVLSGVQHFSDVPLIIHATTQFLAEWLQCEARAVLSYGLAENLLGLARLARQNEELNLMEHLLSGFYKATDSEKGGETYFSEKVGLAEFCFETLRNMSEPRPKALELCNEIITEYFVSLLASDGQIKRMWIAYPAVTQKHNACPSFGFGNLTCQQNLSTGL
ncbi:unnamed protein product [Oikopleura dioica]|uniref:Exportin-1/Importin-beta-like domain-containing protein n=1 Tax=Oikopleura dioica TaxID=34765 RepID=E4Y1P3_OIKDI|nr:unnamed protein product [Oikopleura dioica]